MGPSRASNYGFLGFEASSASLGWGSLDGMNQGELAAVRPRLEAFAAEVFAPLARADQRDKGATYVRGLLLDSPLLLDRPLRPPCPGESSRQRDQPRR